ncbi:hypothetical protein [Streptomyces sp. TE5632]
MTRPRATAYGRAAVRSPPAQVRDACPLRALRRFGRSQGHRRTQPRTLPTGSVGSFIERYEFGVYGYLTAHGPAGTVPARTGARRPGILGSITPGSRRLRLPESATAVPLRLRTVPV